MCSLHFEKRESDCGQKPSKSILQRLPVPERSTSSGIRARNCTLKKICTRFPSTAQYKFCGTRSSSTRGIHPLGAPDCEIFCRYYCYCQTATEITVMRGMSLVSIRQQLNRGRDRLRQNLIRENVERELHIYRTHGGIYRR